jgi:hypothetical protein
MMTIFGSLLLRTELTSCSAEGEKKCKVMQKVQGISYFLPVKNIVPTCDPGKSRFSNCRASFEGHRQLVYPAWQILAAGTRNSQPAKKRARISFDTLLVMPRKHGAHVSRIEESERAAFELTASADSELGKVLPSSFQVLCLGLFSTQRWQQTPVFTLVDMLER